MVAVLVCLLTGVGEVKSSTVQRSVTCSFQAEAFSDESTEVLQLRAVKQEDFVLVQRHQLLQSRLLLLLLLMLLLLLLLFSLVMIGIFWFS